MSEAKNRGTSDATEVGRWRVGRTLGRTIYYDDLLIGMVDTEAAAKRIVEAMNEPLTRAYERDNELLYAIVEAACRVQSVTPCDRDVNPLYESAVDAFDVAFKAYTLRGNRTNSATVCGKPIPGTDFHCKKVEEHRFICSAGGFRGIQERPTSATGEETYTFPGVLPGTETVMHASPDLRLIPSDAITLTLAPNEDTVISCIFCRRETPCEYGIDVRRSGERALVGIHADCVAPFRAKNEPRPDYDQLRASRDRMEKALLISERQRTALETKVHALEWQLKELTQKRGDRHE